MELLGLDMLMEILSRLSVKELIRLKSVSKTFLNLISNDDFIRLHLNKSSLRAIHLNRYTYLCLKQHGESSLRTILINRHIYSASREQYGGEQVDGNKTMCYAMSHGNSNGLLCLLPYHKDNKYASGALLWNPALCEAEFVPIKIPQVKIFNSWFGYDNDEYKLVLGTASHIHLIRLYVDTDTWKSSLKINKNYGCCEPSGTLVHRTVHWSAYDRKKDGEQTIISYDIRNETDGRIGTPDGMGKFNPFVLGQVDGCLSTLFTKRGHSELWVMREYGVEESWTKLMILPCETFWTYRDAEPHSVVELDDPAQLNSPIVGGCYYVESLISPRSIKTNMC